MSALCGHLLTNATNIQQWKILVEVGVGDGLGAAPRHARPDRQTQAPTSQPMGGLMLLFWPFIALNKIQNAPGFHFTSLCYIQM
jgi:hypothetical protein